MVYNLGASWSLKFNILWEPLVRGGRGKCFHGGTPSCCLLPASCWAGSVGDLVLPQIC